MYYSEISTPWPIPNRDLIVKCKIEKESDKKYIVYLKEDPDYFEAYDNMVRIPKFSGTWVLEQTDNKTQVTSQLHVEPGGSIPGWFANLMISEGPFVSLSNLRELLEGEK